MPRKGVTTGLINPIGTVPIDAAQYIGHMLRIAQKLAYIYRWPDLFDGDQVDEATEGILTLFVGVMVGVQAAQGGVTKAAAMIAAQVAKRLQKHLASLELAKPGHRAAPVVAEDAEQAEE